MMKNPPPTAARFLEQALLLDVVVRALALASTPLLVPGLPVGWAWCLAGAGVWCRRLTRLSAVTWAVLALAAAGPLLPAGLRPAAALSGATLLLALVLVLAWVAAVAEGVLRRARPDEAHGRQAPWRHPWAGPVGRALDVPANSRLVRALCEWLPPVAFLSDIT